ncbi:MULTISPECIES: hypothetical protein [unclassified Mycolicibacterium]|uniref:hypothetical protein n=1 Tax=unclassified Mycolicibacterium TaxID=2636767 RepID=UPI0012DD6F58|nr:MULTISPECIES: hypothetical protein [unclassified Mycolicibacterium]MUL83126.1 hypothetical protein [Mycolicibacterium sp. CBMA 329]MUL89461.1 hypothetical protein [Mycolicibacterium sp. CBMA 331]MUL99150.1 hypothetical protein [Mycolicibacterium sp. CBMA 334]MUM25711.1 hypothetical protein [Mycolicibacterium sp. CBMA 295]MUM38977.1 hypothetical protein [Mycolicibacterium sp. CBMA 247]
MSVPGPGGNFDLNDWSFKPAAVPWYRTRRATIALIATALAAASIVVSGVLLLLRDSASIDDAEPTPSSPSPSATSPLPSPSLRVGLAPAPPAPPPPPPEETQQAPVYRPTYRPSETKKPEIGVTRTPVTRSPISVAPQPRHPRS